MQNFVTQFESSSIIQEIQGICLIEDDDIMRQSLSQRFTLEGIANTTFSTIEAGVTALKSNAYQLLISDIRLPDGDFSKVYQQLCEQGLELPPVIFITGYPELQQAVKLLQKGAVDYISKPFDVNKLLHKIRCLAPRLLQSKTARKSLLPKLGVSDVMLNIQHILLRVSDHGATILITGESGVGKEHVARYFHHCCHNNQQPFIALNCAALPDNLMESELFGYEKGAFTGADKMKRGLIELADGGTLFLDEVAEMSLPMQAKLLRILQERKFYRLGGNQEIPVNFNLVSATNKNLRKRVEAGLFREDLYYRLHIVHIHVPPLRERPEDIIWFVKNKIKQFSRHKNQDQDALPDYQLTPAAEQYLVAQPWPGNVRELMGLLERSLIFAQPPFLYPADFEEKKMFSEPSFAQGKFLDLKAYLAECERWYLNQALAQCRWNMTQTAQLLQISRKNLWERINRLGIKKEI